MAKSVYESSAYVNPINMFVGAETSVNIWLIDAYKSLIAKYVGADIIRPLRPDPGRVKNFLKKLKKVLDNGEKMW